MKHCLNNVIKKTENKYINLFEAKYEMNNGEKIYEFVSRKKVPDILSVDKKIDAVRVIPYYYDNENLKIVIIKEFRFAINSYIYATVAGLIDSGETPEQSVTREIREEIGASVKALTQTEIVSYSSAGMSDESIVCYEAEIEKIGEQKLDEFEDIEVLVVEEDELLKMLDSQNFGLQSRLQLRAFLYKKKLERLVKER